MSNRVATDTLDLAREWLRCNFHGESESGDAFEIVVMFQGLSFMPKGYKISGPESLDNGTF